MQLYTDQSFLLTFNGNDAMNNQQWGTNSWQWRKNTIYGKITTLEIIEYLDSQMNKNHNLLKCEENENYSYLIILPWLTDMHYKFKIHNKNVH